MYKEFLNRWKLRVIGRIPFSRPVIRLLTGSKMSSGGTVLFNNIDFKNRIGIGPGIDKDGQIFDILSDFGFSFINIGPVNSSNVKAIISRLQLKKTDTVISICINGSHSKTFSLSYDFADMFCFDIPDDDITETLNDILDIRLTYDQYKPVLLRLSHELPRAELDRILGFCMLNGVDGIVAANTASVRLIRDIAGTRLHIIGYSGIDSPEKAREFIDSGADLLEITSALMKDSPFVAAKINRHLSE